MKSNIELLRLVFHFVSPPLSLTSLTVPAGVQGRQIVKLYSPTYLLIMLKDKNITLFLSYKKISKS